MIAEVINVQQAQTLFELFLSIDWLKLSIGRGAVVIRCADEVKYPLRDRCHLLFVEPLINALAHHNGRREHDHAAAPASIKAGAELARGRLEQRARITKEVVNALRW